MLQRLKLAEFYTELLAGFQILPCHGDSLCHQADSFSTLRSHASVQCTSNDALSIGRYQDHRRLMKCQIGCLCTVDGGVAMLI